MLLIKIIGVTMLAVGMLICTAYSLMEFGILINSMIKRIKGGNTK